MNPIGLTKQTTKTFDEVVAALPDALKAQGFGVVTTVDMQKTLKEKLGADFQRYIIYGVCNPTIALEALSKHLEFGLMMPCNVVLHEAGGKAFLRAVDPTQTFAMQFGPEGEQLAKHVKEKLGAVLSSL